MTFNAGGLMGSNKSFRDFANGKGSAGGSNNNQDPRDYDKQVKKQATVKPLSPGELAKLGTFAEARRQRDLQKQGLDAAQTILGLMPAGPLPLGMGFGLGRWMGRKSEEVLSQNPEAMHSIPDDPGGMYGTVNGMAYSNRAEYPGHSLTSQPDRGAQDNGTLGEDPYDARRKKKAASSQTLLGANPVDTLGTVRKLA